MGTHKTTFFITAGLVIISTMIVVVFERKFGTLEKEFSQRVVVNKTWEMPHKLKEISGISFAGSDRIACVQDEEGIIYLYDLGDREVVQEIFFKKSGDFEGIAVDGKTAYVAESNGTIYEVQNFLSEPQVRVHQTRLTSVNNVEGLFLDKPNNRLLVAIKGKDPNSPDSKGVYAFDLDHMKLQQKPVLTLTFEERIFDKERKNNIQKTFQPSEIAIAPNKEILLLEGVVPKLLILEPTGKPKELHYLEESDFPQPEGLAFDQDGNLFISNEGDPATIHSVEIK